MKQLPRKIRLPLGVTMMVVAIIAGVIGVAQLVSALNDWAWNPVLVAACAFIVIAFPHSAAVLMQRSHAEPSLTKRLPAWVRRPIDAVLWTAWWATVGVLTSALLDRVGGATSQPGPDAVRGAILGIGTLLMMTAFNRGWIKGVLVRPNSVKQRRDELARQRQEILATARQGRTS